MEKDIKGSGMRNSVKNPIGLFLGFEGMGLKDIKKLLKDRVIKGSDLLRGERRAMRLKFMQGMEGDLNPLKNMRRHAF